MNLFQEIYSLSIKLQPLLILQILDKWKVGCANDEYTVKNKNVSHGYTIIIGVINSIRLPLMMFLSNFPTQIQLNLSNFLLLLDIFVASGSQWRDYLKLLRYTQYFLTLKLENVHPLN